MSRAVEEEVSLAASGEETGGGQRVNGRLLLPAMGRAMKSKFCFIGIGMSRVSKY